MVLLVRLWKEITVSKDDQYGFIGLSLLKFLIKFVIYASIVLFLINGCSKFLSNNAEKELTVDPKIQGVVVGFFNGVNVSKDEARDHLKNIISRFGLRNKRGVKIQYQLFYNDSYGLLVDVIETFGQKSTIVENKNDSGIFWDMISGDKSELDRTLANLVNGAEVQDGLWRSYMGMTGSYLSNLATEQKIVTSLDQRELIKKILDKKSHQRLVFISHSQGNLYGIQAFKYAKKYSNQVSILHVAPPIDILNGDYVLSSGDGIINAMRLTGHIPANNVDVPICAGWCEDVTGHGFIATYFNLKNRAGQLTEAKARMLIGGD